MRKQNPLKPIDRAMRLAALGVGVLLLAGCATGYNFVQPDTAGSGGYYTSNGPYAGNGYYDYYGTGPNYPGTGGWGYYNGTYPYSGSFGYGGGYYGDYGYWPAFTFNLGISNVWDFPGYWGPWYSTGFPTWSCAGRGCGGWRNHGRHDRHDHGNSDSPRPWLKPDHPPVPPRVARDTGSAPAVSIPSQPMRRPALESSTFVPGEFVRAPIRRPVETGFNRMPLRPAYMPPVPRESAFANRREMPVPMTMPREVRPGSQPVFRSQPAPAAPPVVAPPPRTTRAPQTQIQ